MVRSASRVPGGCTVKQVSKTLALLARRKERDLRNFQPTTASKTITNLSVIYVH